VKIFFKAYLRKQRSFNRSGSTSSKSSESGSRRRMTFTTALDEVYREIEIMKKLNNPNIIKIYEVIDDPNSEKLYVIMPVADYGDCIEWDPKNCVFKPNHML
jgi:calcium/calmodulin-dependent protein kinase kinase 2